MNRMKLKQGIGEKPLWSQLYDILEEEIITEKYKQGDLLPSEKILIDVYEVSRATVRQAMDRLIVNGLVSRERGKGTFVTKNENHLATSFKSSFHGIKEKNNDRDRRIISVAFVLPPVDVAYFFGIKKTQQVLKLERQTYIDDNPVTYYETYLNPIVGADEKTDFSNSMYQCLAENGYRITRVQEKINASVMDEKEIEMFELTQLDAVINRIRKGYSQDLPIEYTYSKYVANGYELEIELS
jgi:Transcriptional regulators